ncbi:MAG: Asp-tRNA(Asn)/Glu-tRNA(Gln) amidotransferase subunit GatC [Zoogloeaceae bacterium]|jgi:aspartyl-tRNA(Asn)/glutamyl-tRNA(Gln) amidotransferase subunit C|nr:Asp-tRNA(Asn)/Glu-tRNA(Gln) amidotransferase subunit GatC [Zoogloeaceae bacterium]
MSLTLPEVERVAELARLELNPDEAETARQQLNGIFSLIEAMQTVDTAGIAPMAHAQDVSQRLRADAVTHHDADGRQRDMFQSVAPETGAGLYLVPRVIE